MYSEILLEYGDRYTEVGISKLAWIEVFKPNHKESKKLRKKYKKEIKELIPALENNKKDEVIKILDERETQEDSKNYILTGKGDISKMQISKYTYEMLCYNIPLELDDKYLIRAFQIYLDDAPDWADIDVKEFINKNTNTILERVSIILKITNNIFDAISKVIGSELYYYEGNENKKQTSVEKKLSKELRKLIFPKYDKEVINFYKNKETEYMDYFWVKILLDQDYNKYIGIIKEKLLKFKKYIIEIDDDMKILECIKDDDFINDYFLKRIDEYIGINYQEELLAYLNDEEVDLEKLKLKNWNIYYYYSTFLGNITRTSDFSNKTIKKLVKFGELLNYIKLYDRLFISNSAEQIKSFILEYNLPILKVSNWVFHAKDKGGYDYEYNYPFDENFILFLAKENIEDVIKAFNNAKSKSKSLYISTLFELNPEKLKETVLKLSKDKGKTVQTALFNMLTNKEEYKALFIEMSQAKIKASRELGKKLLNTITDFVEEEPEKLTADIDELYDILVKESQKFIKKGKREPVSGVKSFDIPSLPRLRLKDSNEELGLEYSYYIFSLFAKTKEIEKQTVAYEVKELFDKDSLNDFVTEIYYRWKFEAKTKWIFALIATFATEDLISGLGDRFIDMAESRRSVLMRKLLEHFDIFEDLSIIKELEIIILRDQRAMISRIALNEIYKIENKTNKSRNDLVDLYIRNKEDIEYQKERLKNILYTPHFWTYKAWKSQFINKTFNQNLAQTLIWGIYEQPKCTDRPQCLSLTFRLDENNLPIDSDNNEISIKDNDTITLLHPVELSDEEFNSWKEHFKDYELTQPIEQLSLGRYYPKNNEEPSCEPAKGYVIKRGVLRRAIYNEGWDKGYLLDHGDYDTYIKYLDLGYTAEIYFDGDAPSHDFFDDSEEIKLGSLSFSQVVESTVQSDIIFKKIPLRLYSSIYGDIQKVLKKGRKVE